MVLQHESNKQLIQQRLNRFRIPVLLIFLILAAVVLLDRWREGSPDGTAPTQGSPGGGETGHPRLTAEAALVGAT